MGPHSGGPPDLRPAKVACCEPSDVLNTLFHVKRHPVPLFTLGVRGLPVPSESEALWQLAICASREDQYARGCGIYLPRAWAVWFINQPFRRPDTALRKLPYWRKLPCASDRKKDHPAGREHQCTMSMTTSMSSDAGPHRKVDVGPVTFGLDRHGTI